MVTFSAHRAHSPISVKCRNMFGSCSGWGDENSNRVIARKAFAPHDGQRMSGTSSTYDLPRTSDVSWFPILRDTFC